MWMHLYKTEIKIIYFVPLCLIVFDFMVYPDPEFLFEVRGFFFDPKLSRKAFATNSLK